MQQAQQAQQAENIARLQEQLNASLKAVDEQKATAQKLEQVNSVKGLGFRLYPKYRAGKREQHFSPSRPNCAKVDLMHTGTPDFRFQPVLSHGMLFRSFCTLRVSYHPIVIQAAYRSQA